jgi:hypothetical protein
MRISSAGALLLLAACSQAATEDAATAADADDMIDCAVAGATAFERICAVERTQAEGAPVLVVRHPDGGFRRFEVSGDGTGLATADGAQPAAVTQRDDGIEIAVGTDRYRFPATIAGDDSR